MKPSVIDRFSRLGRLERHLQEILRKAEASEIARMEAGDTIEAQMVDAVNMEQNFFNALVFLCLFMVATSFVGMAARQVRSTPGIGIIGILEGFGIGIIATQ